MIEEAILNLENCALDERQRAITTLGAAANGAPSAADAIVGVVTLFDAWTLWRITSGAA